VNFDKAGFQPVLAHCHLRQRLHLEEQQIERAAQVEVAPIHADVDGGQRLGEGIERELRPGKVFHRQRLQLDFQPAQLDDGVVHHCAGDGDGGFGGQGGDQFRQRRVAWLPEGSLHQPGGIPDDEELHFLLIAQGLQKAADLHFLSDHLA